MSNTIVCSKCQEPISYRTVEGAPVYRHQDRTIDKDHRPVTPWLSRQDA